MTCGLEREGEVAPRLDFYIEQGSDFNRWFQVKDSQGNVVSLADWTSVIGQARRSESEESPVAFAIPLTINYAENKIYWSILAEVTRPLVVGSSAKDEASTFYYDFVSIRAGRPKRIQQGRIYIHRDITVPA